MLRGAAKTRRALPHDGITCESAERVEPSSRPSTAGREMRAFAPLALPPRLADRSGRESRLRGSPPSCYLPLLPSHALVRSRRRKSFARSPPGRLRRARRESARRTDSRNVSPTLRSQEHPERRTDRSDLGVPRRPPRVSTSKGRDVF